MATGGGALALTGPATPAAADHGVTYRESKRKATGG